MKKFSWLVLLWITGWVLPAQTPYTFSEIKMLDATPVKNQGNTGTCWAFSTVSFLESEAMRLGKGAHDFSEMHIVRHIYRDKCENYVRRQGKANLGQGGLSHDALNAIARHGLVPESVYPGRPDNSTKLDHEAVEKKLKTMCDTFVELGKKGALPSNWLTQIDAALDEAFGPVPEKFKYNGAEFTPASFRNVVGIMPENYVSLTSFTHHVFYQPFILEVPDNFSNGSFYNLPLEELMKVVQNALQNGYTVEWDADVSNEGFSNQKGIAIVPKKLWANKTNDEQKNTFDVVEDETSVTQAYRQEQFDRQITQDDHLMHIVGLLDEPNAGTFYAVKNSWGEQPGRNGYVYVSDAYMRLNTLSFTVHRSALPTALQQKVGAAIGTGMPVPQLSIPKIPEPMAPDSQQDSLQDRKAPYTKSKVRPNSADQ